MSDSARIYGDLVFDDEQGKGHGFSFFIEHPTLLAERHFPAQLERLKAGEAEPLLWVTGVFFRCVMEVCTKADVELLALQEHFGSGGVVTSRQRMLLRERAAEQPAAQAATQIAALWLRRARDAFWSSTPLENRPMAAQICREVTQLLVIAGEYAGATYHGPLAANPDGRSDFVVCRPDFPVTSNFWLIVELLGIIGIGPTATAPAASSRIQELLDSLARRAKTVRPKDAGESLATVAELALRFDVDQEQLRKRLDRWRSKHQGGGWEEMQSNGSRAPRYVYRIKDVEAMILQLKRDGAG